MEKYLFNDGTNVIREVLSKEELEKQIQSAADPGTVKIWVFSTSEWISPSEWRKRYALAVIPGRRKKALADPGEQPVRPAARPAFNWIKPLLAVVIIAGAAIIIYNLTRVKWVAASPVTVSAERPANVPSLNIDSIIQTIEAARGKKLDKITATNLRIRNTWPDRLLLTLKASRDSSSQTNRFYNPELTLDNATGYLVDEATVKIQCWSRGEIVREEEVTFQKIGYSSPARESPAMEFRGDSLSVRYSAVKAKSFNFCYDEDKKSTSGNYNDRWFCRE